LFGSILGTGILLLGGGFSSMWTGIPSGPDGNGQNWTPPQNPNPSTDQDKTLRD